MSDDDSETGIESPERPFYIVSVEDGDDRERPQITIYAGPFEGVDGATDVLDLQDGWPRRVRRMRGPDGDLEHKRAMDGRRIDGLRARGYTVRWECFTPGGRFRRR